jgi:hypothetical protein
MLSVKHMDRQCLAAVEISLNEDNAKKLIKLLVNKGAKDDGFVQAAMVTKWAVEAGMEDILHDALVFAGDNDWIADGPIKGTIKLTPKGFAIGKAP